MKSRRLMLCLATLPLLVATAGPASLADPSRPFDVSSLAGKRVAFCVDVSNRTAHAAASMILLRQYAADGRELPESVVDPRMLSGIFPAGVGVRFRESGRVHPEARTARLVLSKGTESSLSVGQASLSIDENAPAAREWLFADGISGSKGDRAIKLDGDTAFYFATGSQACWAEGCPSERQDELFYPLGSGTVEAWFRPDWTAFFDPAKDAATVCTLFEAKGDFRFCGAQPGAGVRLRVTYAPKGSTIAFVLRDADGTAFSADGTAKFPQGEWTHVALQWNPGGAAELFVNGCRIAARSLAGWALFAPGGGVTTDQWVAEFHLGSTFNAARERATVPADETFFVGAADLLRVSSCTRYGARFAPVKSFAVDPSTRALYGFDGCVDGVSGGGTRFVPGSVRAARSVFADSDGECRHGPEGPFDLVNYRRLPSADDFHTPRTQTVRTFRARSGDRLSFSCPEDAVPDFVEIANESSSPLAFPAVIGRGEVDPRSFSDMARSFRRPDLSDRERADRAFQWLVGAVGYHSNYTADYASGSQRPHDMEYDPLLMLNGYCAFECGPMNHLASQVFAGAAGLPANRIPGYWHVMEHVFVDGRFRVYDLCVRSSFDGGADGGLATVADMDAEPGILHRRATATSFFGDAASPYVRLGARGTGVYSLAPDRRIGVTLNPGERFRAWRGNDGSMNDLQMRGGECRRTDRFFPDYANGFLVFEGRPDVGNPAFASVGGDSFVYRVSSGYPIVGGEYAALREDGTPAPVELSFDGGRTFCPQKAGHLTYAVRARHSYLVRVLADGAKVRRFCAVTEVQMNPRVMTGLPRGGRNEMTFTSEGSGIARLSFAWRSRGNRPARPLPGVCSGAVPGFEHRLVLGDVSPGARSHLEHDDAGGIRLSHPGAVLMTAHGQVGSSLSADGIQSVVTLDGTRRSVLFSAGGLTAGNYAVFVCSRFPSRTKRRAERKTLCIGNPAAGSRIRFAGARNSVYEYLFDDYGPEKGRGRFKWDYLPLPDGSVSSFAFGANSGVELSTEADADETVEVAAVLLLPVPLDREFSCELVKTLCGLATVPGRISSGATGSSNP